MKAPAKPAARHTDLICRKAVRAFILAMAARTRPGWRCTRVSGEAYGVIQAHLRASILRMIQQHPSGCGQTFKPYF